MNKTLIVRLVVVVVAIAAAVCVAVQQSSGGKTSEVKCVDSTVITWAGSTIVGDGQSFQTVTTLTSFTSTTNTSATVGHVAAENFSGAYGLTGEASTQRSCTFVK